MKTSVLKLRAYLCRSRFTLAVVTGLGLGWALSRSLGPAVGFGVGGGLTVTLLSRSGSGCTIFPPRP